MGFADVSLLDPTPASYPTALTAEVERPRWEIPLGYFPAVERQRFNGTGAFSASAPDQRAGWPLFDFEDVSWVQSGRTFSPPPTVVLRATSNGITTDTTVIWPFVYASALPAGFHGIQALREGWIWPGGDTRAGFSFRGRFLYDRYRRFALFQRKPVVYLNAAPGIGTNPSTAASLPPRILGIRLEWALVGIGLALTWRRAVSSHSATFQASIDGGAFASVTNVSVVTQP